ncbi:MAG: protein BatD [Gammaproteobacteria bacterium]|nr:protein BatD [Gammaproteobacteria bacterium]
MKIETLKKYGNLMRTQYLIYLCLIFGLSVSHAAVTAVVDRDQVSTNETFTLTIELDEFISGSPDLSVLPPSIQELGSSKFQRSSTINGQTQVQMGWKIQLMIDKEGVYTIPAIPVDKYKTAPIQITVKPASNSYSADEKADAIMLKSELSTENIYVQQQLIYTVRLYRAVQTQYASLTEPNIENALVEKLGEDSQYEAMIDGTRYWVLERRYAIFPQESGKLTIPKVIFSADVVQRSGSGYGRILGRTKPVTVATEPSTVKVQSFPKNHDGVWLPSENVSLKARWSETKEKVVGEPSTWTITLTGVGLHENQLPELEFPPVDGLKYYPDTAEKSRKISNSGLIGQRVERIAVVPTKSGKITLPPVSIRWFNVKTEQYETATLEPEVINVLENPELNQSQSVVTPTNLESQESANVTGSTEGQSGASNDLVWKITTLIFAILWILTLMLYLLNKKRPNAYSDDMPQSSRLPNTPNKERLIQALATESANESYQAMLNWLHELNGASISYSDAMERINDKKLREALQNLEKSIFSANATPWDDYKLVRRHLNDIEAALKLKIKNQNNNNEKLRPLYPN